MTKGAQKDRSLLSGLDAPQVGLEPTTLRLTAECSAIELLRNIGIRRRPTLPDRYQSSTIGTEGLNFCVRYGNRCDPFVITTGNGELIQAGSLRRPFLPLRLPACPALSQGTCLHGLNVSHADNCTVFDSVFRPFFNQSQNLARNQALDRLVSSSSIRYRTSTDDLSTR